MTQRRGQEQRRGGRGRRVVAATAGAMVVGGLFVPAVASAHAGGATKAPKATKVVKEEMRSPYGEILTNLKSHALYIQTSGTCTGSCLTIWPPLLMPKHKTMPAGASGLGTVSTSAGLQVTYNSEPLYTFYTDTKKSVSGENQGGFVVAQVTAPAS
jgi:predicted lipoprotein with Yx(FWY)xxD motif